MLIVINKIASFCKSASQRGEERGSKALLRIVTGTDKDGSPQYRYFRSEDELAAYKEKHKKDTKQTHEKIQKEHHKIAKESNKKEDKKPYILDSKKKDKKEVKKSLYVII